GRDANAFGYIILDSTEIFRVRVQNNLPFTYLLEPPSRTVIRGISQVCDSSCGENYYKTTPVYVPIKKENTESRNFRIVNNVYQYRVFSDRTKGLESFQFQNFRETRDSLFFYNLDDVESLNGKHVDSLNFKKTEVVIAQGKNGEIVKIVIEDL